MYIHIYISVYAWVGSDVLPFLHLVSWDVSFNGFGCQEKDLGIPVGMLNDRDKVPSCIIKGERWASYDIVFLVSIWYMMNV